MSQPSDLHEQPRGLALWWAGARPRTLPVSVVPVAVGVGAAASYSGGLDTISWWRALLALVVSLSLQIAVNYANDYSDGVRGTDKDRVGPLRLTGSGLVAPPVVKRAAFAFFGLAAVCGLVLALATAWWLLFIGAAAIAAAWFYTGGSTPYGYRGLGDVSVFVFFGLVAVVGSAYVAGENPRLTWLALAVSVPIGLLAVAVLVANNLRDLPKDALVGKRTLAVRLGPSRTRAMYVGCVVAPFAVAVLAIWHPWLLLVLLAVPLTVLPVRRVLAGAAGRDLIPVLAATGRLQLVFGILLAVGLVIGPGWGID